MTETGIRVALADDDVLLREGLASLLKQSGFAVVGQCGDGSQLIALIREHEPELAIVWTTARTWAPSRAPGLT